MKKEFIHVRCSKEEKKEIIRAAKKRGYESVSAFIRDTMDKEINK